MNIETNDTTEVQPAPKKPRNEIAVPVSTDSEGAAYTTGYEMTSSSMAETTPETWSTLPTSLPFGTEDVSAITASNPGERISIINTTISFPSEGGAAAAAAGTDVLAQIEGGAAAAGIVLNTEKRTSAMTNTTSGYSVVSKLLQTRNSGDVVVVHEVLDDTESLTAMDTIPFIRGTRNFDIGGGRFDEPTQHLWHFYGVINLVYDPYNRSKAHNEEVLAQVHAEPVDSVTSNSVLNVILDEKERNEHIRFAHNSLKPGGVAFFKVWRGNNSSVADEVQSNKEAKHYVPEIQNAFGEENVKLIEDDIGNTIFAYK